MNTYLIRSSSMKMLLSLIRGRKAYKNRYRIVLVTDDPLETNEKFEVVKTMKGDRLEEGKFWASQNLLTELHEEFLNSLPSKAEQRRILKKWEKLRLQYESIQLLEEEYYQACEDVVRTVGNSPIYDSEGNCYCPVPLRKGSTGEQVYYQKKE